MHVPPNRLRPVPCLKVGGKKTSNKLMKSGVTPLKACGSSIPTMFSAIVSTSKAGGV